MKKATKSKYDTINSYGWVYCDKCKKPFRDVDNKGSIEEEKVCMACSYELQKGSVK